MIKVDKTKERNGRIYLGAWIDKEVLNKAKKSAKKEKRTLAAYVELALAYHNQSK